KNPLTPTDRKVHPVPRSLPGIIRAWLPVFFTCGLERMGWNNPSGLRRHGFIGRATRAKPKNPKTQKPKNPKTQKPKNLPAEGRKDLFRLLRFSQPIRSSPKFIKANSIVWMTPNERVGAWMPLGR